MKANQATTPVVSGTILLREGVLLPEQLNLKTEKHSADWRILPEANGYALDRQLRVVGWSCTLLSGEIKTISFGRSQAAMLKSGVRRLLAKVRGLDYNCAEIATIKHSRFLGVPYVTICAHARHIQSSYELGDKAQRRKQQKAIDWARG